MSEDCAFAVIGAGIAELLDPSMSYAARLSLSVTAVLVFSTVVQMVFGELAPKNLAIARTVPLARALSRSTLVYLTVAGPLVRLFDRASTTLLRKVGIEPVEELEHGATAEDLTRIIDESHAGGLLDEVEGLRRRGDLSPTLPSIRCVGYRQAWAYLEGEIDMAALREQGIAATRQLCKRQITWLRSTPERHVVDCLAPDYVDQVARLVQTSLESQSQ